MHTAPSSVVSKAARCLLVLVAGSPACLDAATGSRAGDVADAVTAPEVVASDTDAVPNDCREPGLPISHIADDPGRFAVGACGVVGYWHESTPRQLMLVDPNHTVRARHDDLNGYDGGVQFSPSGRRVLATSLRSDLGFGDVAVGAFPLSGPFVVDATLGFGGSAEVLFTADEQLELLALPGIGDSSAYLRIEGGTDLGPFERLVRAGEQLFFTRREDAARPDGSDTTLLVRPIAGTPRVLTPLRVAWLDGSTMRTRGAFRPSGDGTRVVLGNECQNFGPHAAPCPFVATAVLDVATGGELATGIAWREPVVGPRALVAGTTDQGVAVLEPGGNIATLTGDLVGVTRDQVLTTQGGTLFAWSPGESAGRTVASAYATHRASPGGTRVAVLFDDAGVDGARSAKLGVWGDGARTDAQAGADFGTLLAVFDDGVVVAAGPGRVAVVGADGAVIATSEARCARNIERRGDALYVELCQTANDALHRITVAGADRGRDDVLAEGHEFTLAVDPSGDYVAFSFLPLSGTTRELHAGRVPAR